MCTSCILIMNCMFRILHLAGCKFSEMDIGVINVYSKRLSAFHSIIIGAQRNKCPTQRTALSK